MVNARLLARAQRLEMMAETARIEIVTASEEERDNCYWRFIDCYKSAARLYRRLKMDNKARRCEHAIKKYKPKT